MNKQEAAAALGITKRQVERWIRRGKLKATHDADGRVNIDRADLGLPPEPAPAPAVEPKAAPMVERLTPSPVSHNDEAVPATIETFRDSLGFRADDPNACTMLGPHPFGTTMADYGIRTTITHEPITYTFGNAKVPSGFKQNLGYGTSEEGLQREREYYRRHPKEAMRRFGSR